MPQSFFVSVFLGEATRASLRASHRYDQSINLDTTPSDLTTKWNNATALKRLRKKPNAEKYTCIALNTVQVLKESLLSRTADTNLGYWFVRLVVMNHLLFKVNACLNHLVIFYESSINVTYLLEDFKLYK